MSVLLLEHLPKSPQGSRFLVGYFFLIFVDLGVLLLVYQDGQVYFFPLNEEVMVLLRFKSSEFSLIA